MIKCRKCGSTNMALKDNVKNPSAVDLYCTECGAWQKFANKDDKRIYNYIKQMKESREIL